MIFSVRYMIELPYILNLPDGTYTYKYNNENVEIKINNNFYAMSTLSPSLPLTKAIGPIDQLSNNIPDGCYLIKTKSILSFQLECTINKLTDATHSDLINEIRRHHHQVDHYPTEEEGEKLISAFSADEYKAFEQRVKIFKTSLEIFPAGDAPKYILLANHFIKYYCLHFDDHIAEEISIYQLASSLTNGVMQQHFFDGMMISSAPYVGGSIFPLMRNALFLHDEKKTESFRTSLLNDELNRTSELLLLRARNLETKGAYRSATIEASAAMENFILTTIRDKMLISGHCPDKTSTYLKNNWKFEERCKRIFKEFFGVTVCEIAPHAWECVKLDRDNTRHRTTHTSYEPSENDTNLIIKNISTLILEIKKHLFSSEGKDI
ncbi:hypothetical protein ABEI05_12705 [Erwinia billingiae]|uniref:hypothetical protein n=1 Tax=Erwinia billingiae TaxID=182337 RepID=UPI003208DC53